MKSLRTTSCLVGLACLFSGGSGGAVHAQTVRGHVVEDGGHPVGGALVLLLSESGDQVTGALSGDRGEFAIRSPIAGRYSLRVQRIGFADDESELFELRAGETVTRTVPLRGRAIELGAIQVRGRSRCTVRPHDGLLVSQLWDEARKALQAAVFTDRERIYGYRVRNHRRVLDASTMQVVRDSVRERETIGEASPYRSLPIDSLLTHGFIQQASDGVDYHAPDAHALLSDPFLDAYCFRLAELTDQDDVVGLAFEPVDRRGPPAVRGTLWLDRESHELRWLDFQYMRTLSALERDARVGGRVEFEPMPNGSWIVRRWRIRFPGHARASALAGERPWSQSLELTTLVEEGGAVLETRAGSGRRRVTELATVEGMVYDSARAQPLSGALVYLAGTTFRDTTDTDGRFRIAGVPEGEYAITFTHPQLRRFNVHPPAAPVVVNSSGETTMDLGLPVEARADALAETCTSDSEHRRNRSGILVGRIVDDVTETALPGATLSVEWSTISGAAGVALTEQREAVVVTADSDGSFVVCGLPRTRPLRVHATRSGPVRGASPVAELSAGGFDESGIAEFDIRIPARAYVLDEIEVVAQPAVEEARRRSGARVALLTWDDIAPHASSARNVGDLARRLPGVRASEIYHRGSSTLKEICLEASRGQVTIHNRANDDCPGRILVVLDGVPMSDGSVLLTMAPSRVESLQFLNAAEGTRRFGSAAGRGVLVIYTRGNGPFAKRDGR